MPLSRVPSVLLSIASAYLIGCSWPETLGDSHRSPLVTASHPARHGRMPAAVQHTTTQPVSAGAANLGPPYRLDVPTITRLVFEKSRKVAASREEMVSAVYGLEEFRTNLSRFEPFAEMNSDYSEFPRRKGTRTLSGEATVGIRKETFDGAIFRIEGGGSSSHARMSEPDEGQDPVQSGSSGLVRGRIEVPFVGSKKRQDRIINQAFQESSARKARLEYLSVFRLEVLDAMSFYNAGVWDQSDGDAYARQVADMEKLVQDARLDEPDRSRVRSVIADYRSKEAERRLLQRYCLRYLLASLGLPQTEEVTLVTPEYRESPFIERAAKPEGVAEMIEEAKANNPTFRVLDDAIRDAELQRRLAAESQLDITAFAEGTHFPQRNSDFDDRSEGWMVSGGVAVSLNDRRVLSATRRKAEANIRAFHAKAEVEMIEIERQIVMETESLRTDRERRAQLLDVIRQKRDEYRSRSEVYLTSKRVLIDQVIESRTDLTTAEVNLNNLLYGDRSSEMRLQATLGIFYQMAGLSLSDLDMDLERSLR